MNLPHTQNCFYKLRVTVMDITALAAEGDEHISAVHLWTQSAILCLIKNSLEICPE